jgi:hypothetical protein
MKPKRNIASVIAIIGLIALIATPWQAQAQVEPTTIGTFTLPSTLVTADATSNVLSAIIVQQGKPLAISPLFAVVAAGTDNVVFTLDLSLDGTNYATTGTISLTNAATGTTAVRGYHVIPASSIGPARFIRLKTIHNDDDANINVTNVTYAWPN